MRAPRLSVVIPHANERRKLDILLQSLNHQRIEECFEVLVVKNPPGSDVERPSWGFVYRWLTSETGANSARQAGLREARGEVVLFLDDDCVLLSDDFLQRHWEHHQRNPALAGVGGFYELTSGATSWAKAYHEIQQRWLRKHRLPSGDSLHLLGGNSSFKVEKIQGEAFDTSMRFGGTESEWQIRLQARGCRLRLFDDLTVGHDGALSLRSFLRKAFQQGVGHAFIGGRHRRPSVFIYADEGPPQSPAWALKLYRDCFTAGRAFYERTGLLRASPALIDWLCGKEISKNMNPLSGGLFKELRLLWKMGRAGLFSSKRSSEFRFPEKYPTPKNQNSDTH